MASLTDNDPRPPSRRAIGSAFRSLAGGCRVAGGAAVRLESCLAFLLLVSHAEIPVQVTDGGHEAGEAEEGRKHVRETLALVEPHQRPRDEKEAERDETPVARRGRRRVVRRVIRMRDCQQRRVGPAFGVEDVTRPGPSGPAAGEKRCQWVRP